MIANDPAVLPLYALFNGRSRRGGQSLDVRDAVFRPAFEASYFPPTEGAAGDVAKTCDMKMVPPGLILGRLRATAFLPSGYLVAIPVTSRTKGQ